MPAEPAATQILSERSTKAHLDSLPQIVFGTDYPYVTTEWNAKALRDAGLPEDQIRAIEVTNAYQLVPRLKA